MDNASKGLLMAAGVLITIVIITFGMVFLNASKGMVSTANEEVADFQLEMAQAKYKAFDNTTVTGAQVVSAINKYADGSFGVGVKKNSGGYIWYGQTSTSAGVLSGATTGSSIDKAKDESDAAYVNPSGKFNAIIYIDSDEIVRAIRFTQK